MLSHRIAADTLPLAGAKQRILSAAYDSFHYTPLARWGLRPLSLKPGLPKCRSIAILNRRKPWFLAFLAMRESLWTHAWLENEMLAIATAPTARLLAIFDILDRWFQEPDFEGCSFINVLLESEPHSPIHAAATTHLAHIRLILEVQAVQAGLADPVRFSHTWHFLMNGSIVAAHEGNPNPAKQAKEAATMILQSWPRV